MKKLIIPFILIVTLSFAQQRYLVSPNQEVIPLSKNDRISDIIARRTAGRVQFKAQECGNTCQFGYSTDMYTPNRKLGAWWREVIGQWYVAQAAGTIDTVYWYGYENGAADSLVFLRIHESIVGPDYGPGVGNHANAPPCQTWGYWKNSLDLQNSLAAFPGEATDTTWFSTINEKGGTVAPTRPPVGYSKWGSLGYGKIHRLGLNSVAMLAAGEPCSVEVGEKFFISFRVNSSIFQHLFESPTCFAGWGSNGPLTTSDEDWPARIWKFCLKDTAQINCSGNPGRRGWIARGPINDDPMYTETYNIWYSMTATTNLPPVINQVEGSDPGITFNTIGPYIIEYEIYDCDPSEPENAAVASAEVRWSKGLMTERSVDLMDQPPVTMTPVGGDLWQCELPGQSTNTLISYRIAATDNKGMTKLCPTRSFRIYNFKQQYYLVDTGTCSTSYIIKVLGSTTELLYSDFFTETGVASRDEGTAGPFDIGGPMLIFGDTARYAWIGINGAIALSKESEDTLDVNSDGSYTDWILPYSQHHVRNDSINPKGMPPNFIAPFWADFILADTVSPPTTFGHIFYGNADDTCLFIVEYDSIGSYNLDSGKGETDATTFRVVLNRCDGTIEFQYDNVGSMGKDSMALVGLQADSSELSGQEPGWVFVNYFARPYETKPRPGFCVKFYPGAPVFATAGWNLLSVANNRGEDTEWNSVYPDALNLAVRYEAGSYQQKKILENGAGYWLKYDKYAYAGAPGYPKNSVTINIDPGWNMIGSISKSVPKNTIIRTPAEMIISEYFRYGYDGYHMVTPLEPGLGHWVKADRIGTLDLISTAAMSKTTNKDYSRLEKITIADNMGRTQVLYIGENKIIEKESFYTGEIPPPAPDFDARFSLTGGMIAGYDPERKGRVEYAISVTTSAYPVTVAWETAEPFTLYSEGRMICAMEGSGSVQLKNTKGLVVRMGVDREFPKVFALSQNYPNPFNPVTRFTLDIPRLTDVRLAVYNLLGQKVKTLMNGETDPGSYDLEWNGTDENDISVPSGIYFIRMMSGNFSDTRKIIFLK